MLFIIYQNIHYKISIVPALILLSLSVVLCLKLISYCHVMGNAYKVIQKLKKIEETKSNDSIPENEMSPEVYLLFLLNLTIFLI